jgi:hypothetical protein
MKFSLAIPFEPLSNKPAILLKVQRNYVFFAPLNFNRWPEFLTWETLCRLAVKVEKLEFNFPGLKIQIVTGHILI